MMMPQLPMQPPLARPLFLEHEERRRRVKEILGNNLQFSIHMFNHLVFMKTQSLEEI